MLVVKVCGCCVVLQTAYCRYVFCIDYNMTWTFLDNERFISALSRYGQHDIRFSLLVSDVYLHQQLLLLENATKSDGAHISIALKHEIEKIIIYNSNMQTVSGCRYPVGLAVRLKVDS